MTSTPSKTHRSEWNERSPSSPDKEEHPYQGILALAAIWKGELEEIRDSIYWLQVQNSQLLDALCMAKVAEHH